MRRQAGLALAMVIVIIAIAITGILATMMLSRITTSDAGRNDTVAKLNAAAAALDQFAAANHRLPCPADPALDTGVEAFTNAATGKCAADDGTLPWKTLGQRREDGYDAWSLKISYRVYTGNKGSLTQPEGVNMTQCDITEPSSGNTNGAGLCVTNVNPLLRSTSAAKFLNGKSLSLSENGTNRDNVAYIVMSHGATGIGAFTANGVRRVGVGGAGPSGDEDKNTRADGPFTIRAFSGSDVESTSSQHFDDLLVYRTLPDLVKVAGLEAHEWDDGGVVGTTLLNTATVSAALGQASVSPSDVGASTLNMGAVTVSSSGGNVSVGTTSVTTINADGTTTVTAVDGIGVAGNAFFGLFGADFLSSVNGEYLAFAFPSAATKFGVTLSDFGIVAGAYYESVEFRFLDASGSTVASIVKPGCQVDGGLASFSITTSSFRTVEIRPRNLYTSSGPTTFPSFLLVSEVKACTSAATTCTTSLATASNTCP